VFVLRLRGIDYVTNSISLAATRRGSLETSGLMSIPRIVGNVAFSIEDLAAYTGAFAFILLLIALAILMLRRQVYLPLVLIAPVAVIWFNQEQHLRYYPAPMALLLLCGAVVLAWLIRRMGSMGAIVALAAIVVWAVVQWLPFAIAAAQNPAALPLPPVDRQQYVESDAGGFGFAEVYAALADKDAAEVIGMISNCEGLRYAAPRDLREVITCPQIRPDGQDREALAALMQSNRRAGVYVILEDSAYVPESAPGTLIASIEADRPRLSIYDLAP
jgi:hypothetical protein